MDGIFSEYGKFVQSAHLHQPPDSGRSAGYQQFSTHRLHQPKSSHHQPDTAGIHKVNP